MPARPAPYASNPVLVHRLVRLLHASFRPFVTKVPLRFAITSPPSGCEGDFHPQAVEHARHTELRRCSSGSAPRTSYWTVKVMVLLLVVPVEIKLAWAVTEYVPVEDLGLSL